MNQNTELLYVRPMAKDLPRHTPLIVKAIADKYKSGKVVAFLRRQLCLFENDSLHPNIGDEVEVMITRWRWRKTPEGMFDTTKPLAYMLRVVEPEKHVLVRHHGFECSGSMCSTTATIHVDKDRRQGTRDRK